MNHFAFISGAAVLVASAPAHAQGIVGDWTEPTGSVIRIAQCGPDLCAHLVSISAKAPSQFDEHNPEQSARTRPLCGLEIGRDFHLSDANHAEGGSLYDPKSGKTYRGSMASSGDKLDLRGYIGIKLFGRSETWTRSSTPPHPCVPPAPPR